MSYDYDAITSQIAFHRRIAYGVRVSSLSLEGHGGGGLDAVGSSFPSSSTLSRIDHLQNALDLFSALSGKCPMTPLLWMQYARDAGEVVQSLLTEEEEEEEEEKEKEGEKTRNGGGGSDEAKAAARRQAIDARASVLELAISEFPGCAPLRLMHLQDLVALHKVSSSSLCGDGSERSARSAMCKKVESAFDDALTAVGMGSHRNEDLVVSLMYRMYLRFLESTEEDNDDDDDKNGNVERVKREKRQRRMLDLFATRARVPMKTANDGLADEFSSFRQRQRRRREQWQLRRRERLCRSGPGKNNDDDDDEAETQKEEDEEEKEEETAIRIEQGRRYASRAFANYIDAEDECSSSMAEEGLLVPESMYDSFHRNHSAMVDWDALLNSADALNGNCRYLVGLGGHKTAAAFVTYAKKLANAATVAHDNDDQDDDARKNIYRKRKRGSDDSDDDNYDFTLDPKRASALALSIYERAASECPTVERIWVSYARHLTNVLRRTAMDATAALPSSSSSSSYYYYSASKPYAARPCFDMLRSVLHRATKNCPYSQTLYTMRMECLDIGWSILGNNVVLFDLSSEIDKIISDACDSGFLPDKAMQLELRMVGFRTVLRRIMARVSTATVSSASASASSLSSSVRVKIDPRTKKYDEAEDVPVSDADKTTRRKKKKKKKGDGNDNNGEEDDGESGDTTRITNSDCYQELDDDDAKQDVRDLIDDLRESYDAADAYLRKCHGKWTAGRAALWSERARAEAYALTPIYASVVCGTEGVGKDEEGGKRMDSDGAMSDEPVRCYEKAVRIHQPAHPDVWLQYVRYVLGRPIQPTIKKEDDDDDDDDNENENENDNGNKEYVRPERPGAVAARLRRARGLFLRAMASVKKQNRGRNEHPHSQRQQASPLDPNGTYSGWRHADAALYDLAREYIDFERTFGSIESYAHASKLVRGKMGGFDDGSGGGGGGGGDGGRADSANGTEETLQISPQEAVATVAPPSSSSSLPIADEKDDAMDVEKTLISPSLVGEKEDGNGGAGPARKKTKVDAIGELPAGATDTKSSPTHRPIVLGADPTGNDDEVGDDDDDDDDMKKKKKTNLKVIKTEHKVRVGKLEYPAHPFSVRVSNLSPDVEDMDLVDALLDRCGPIVHARIVREHHGPRKDGRGKSRGYGLVQFEERESVGRALELDGIVGLGGRLVRVERSHMAAVSVVPPGMHRVRPRGEGRNAKRNRKMRERHGRGEETTGGDDDNSDGGGGGGGGGSSKDEKESAGMEGADGTSPVGSQASNDGVSKKVDASRPKKADTSLDILAFRPRGLHGQKHHRVKLDLGDKKS